ncbi:MAG TPA: hypothetical protein VED47_12480 [Burkholderiaceae bacterium]|nr:hypothetical protein [Burkholderiaceae bacterium]
MTKPTVPKKPLNYWPLFVPPACIGLWWCILAEAFDTGVANTFAIVTSCAVAVVAALVLLADALGIQDKYLHGSGPDDSGRTRAPTGVVRALAFLAHLRHFVRSNTDRIDK